jgi:hypothetical protein
VLGFLFLDIKSCCLIIEKERMMICVCCHSSFPFCLSVSVRLSQGVCVIKLYPNGKSTELRKNRVDGMVRVAS